MMPPPLLRSWLLLLELGEVLAVCCGPAFLFDRLLGVVPVSATLGNYFVMQCGVDEHRAVMNSLFPTFSLSSKPLQILGGSEF